MSKKDLIVYHGGKSHKIGAKCKDCELAMEEFKKFMDLRTVVREDTLQKVRKIINGLYFTFEYEENPRAKKLFKELLQSMKDKVNREIDLIK